MIYSDSTRFATFNASLNRDRNGKLITDLSTKTNAQAQNGAEIIQRVNPDVVLINEFDFDQNAQAAQLFRQNYLTVSQNNATPINYPYLYTASSNTGIPTNFDLDNNNSIDANDAFGFGLFPGQYGMVLYSKYPIDTENIRTFQKFLWQDMPDALLPDDSTTPKPNDWYSPEELEVFRLSSKSHWDIPIKINDEIVHVLASHPTPPVFDSQEDRNGRRNHDEIRFWSDYITPGKGEYIYDDAGSFGNLAAGSRFVIMGDQNADPVDGDSTNNAILQLLNNPIVNTTVTPVSEGGIDAAMRQAGANQNQQGNPAFDTADFADTTPGNLRVDYVLPSQNLKITDAKVFWAKNEDPLFRLVGDFNPNIPGGFPSSDHRLVAADVAIKPDVDINKKTITDIKFLGEARFNTDLTFNNTQVGGLSGITYDHVKNVYYSISDDRSSLNPARFYTLAIDLQDGKLQNGDIKFRNVTTLLEPNGKPFVKDSLDPEGIALTDKGTLFISSEGDAEQLIKPFVNQFSLQGNQFQQLPIPQKFLPTQNKTQGIRGNLAFESLTITPNNQYLYTATENALIQDGAEADLINGSSVRILQYNLQTNQPQQEFVYVTDPVAAESVPPNGFKNNGLVDLLAIDNNGTLLALERSFSAGVGNTIKLYQVRTQQALDVSSIDKLSGLEVDSIVEKSLLIDFADLGLDLDNIEGLSFGPQLPDGRQSLVVVSDNNFSDTQFTQFLAFSIGLDTIPAIKSSVETPPVVDVDSPLQGNPVGDADDPAIYVHPQDPALSLVIGTLKDGGLAVYDLNGKILQAIAPKNLGDIRYNNVDLVYGFKLGGKSVDLAVTSDRQNDTLAIFQIDPATRRLKDVTAAHITPSIFGVDDGEKTAYGLATYTSSVSGNTYVFVSQRDANQVAQLQLIDNGVGVDVKRVRSFSLPIPQGGELADAQIEGMVTDRELGYVYLAQENVGIWKFAAETQGGNQGVLVDQVKPQGQLTADAEGLTIYYAGDRKGYLLASSQGDSSFVVYDKQGDNKYLGNFVIGESQNIDAVQASDGADVVNVPLGSRFPSGLIVVHDGSNDPAVIVDDDGVLENASTNFKFVPWQNVADAFDERLQISPTGYNPRQPLFNTIKGTNVADDLIGTDVSDAFGGSRSDHHIFGFIGNDTLSGGRNHDLLTGGSDRDTFVINRGDGIDTITDFSGVTEQEDTINFQGKSLTAKNMRLTQTADHDLLISFDNVDDTRVVVNNFNLENLDNSSVNFNKQNQDSFDIFQANAQNQQIFKRDSVTFLNDLDNRILGFEDSQDVINGQGGNDLIKGLGSNDLLRGGTGNDALIGGRGSDLLFGGNGRDTLLGQKGKDLLSGGINNDLLNGGIGNDTLQGEAGNDTLIGGSGSDLFVLNAANETDIISDFNLKEHDQIGLSGGVNEDLKFIQGMGNDASNTIINAFGQNIAILVGVLANSLNSNVFNLG